MYSNCKIELTCVAMISIELVDKNEQFNNNNKKDTFPDEVLLRINWTQLVPNENAANSSAEQSSKQGGMISSR